MGIFDKILRTGDGKKLRALQALVPDIDALESATQALSDDALRAKTAEFQQRHQNGEPLDDLLVESFAVVREAASRVLGQRHYPVQLMGGAALHLGWVAEMKTGEGKTLTSLLPVYLNGVGGKGVHVVTVNDYLATRDSEWMGEVHRWLGLSVGLIVPGNRDTAHKREMYACDITYGTNNELGFDYLRDNMAMSLERKAQRGHNYCIVDEIDSILIDEARTPLIISGRLAEAAQTYYQFASIARGLRRDIDYDVDEEKRIVAPTEEGIHSVEAALGIDNLYDSVSSNLVHHLQQSLRAKELYRRDKDYIIKDGEVKIVDEFTGRVLDGRRWSEGLHQAVEAKEGVAIKEENQTLATVTLQNYFRLYDKLAGMTGTAETEASEFANTYNLQVVPIPTNKPLARVDEGDLIYKSEDAKFQAIIDDLSDRHAKGQPVLVGTVSVENSEKLSRVLEQRGIPHNVLNAKQHTREAEVVAQAGRVGSVTVATNMAGRGVDIVLGGNAEKMAEREVEGAGLELESDEGQELFEIEFAKFEAACRTEGDKVRELGGLYVLATERHDSRRIDNQLRGRSGRQGDPGESRFYLSLEDDLMRLFATGAMDWVMGRALPEDEAIEAKMVSKAIERAQTTVEQKNAEVRKNVLKYDEVMNEQRKVIYKRRDQILEGADLRAEAFEYLGEAVDALVASHAVSDHTDDWDLDTLATEVATYWPTDQTEESLEAQPTTDALYEVLVAEATAHYEAREEEITPEIMRQVERQVMLQIIDQRWREHLYEMDYLREGIHLRAMGQKDPASEWQREGFEMFGHMMTGIAQDFVKYIMHVQVNVNEEPAPTAAEQAVDVEESAPDAQAETASRASGTATPEVDGAPKIIEENQTAKKAPVKLTEFEKAGRNDPCPCGSGDKFKHCHGKK